MGCNVFLKCSLHYHANQFVVMMMMMMMTTVHSRHTYSVAYISQLLLSGLDLPVTYVYNG